MTLEETLNALAAQTRRADICSWQVLMNNLSEKDCAAIEKALERKIPYSIIVKALRTEGHNTSNDSMRAHQKGTCRCQRK